MAARFLVVAAVANAVLAYSNTSPIVAWSSLSSFALDSLPSRFDSDVHSASILESILNADDVCNHEAIVIVDQPGLHASDLRSLSPNTHLARSLSLSPSARQYPYLPAHPSLDITSLAESVSSKCRSQLLQYVPGQSDVTLKHGSKHVICMNMPHLAESGKERKNAMVKHETLLGIELSTLASTFPDHLVIYTGSPLHSSPSKRQAPNTPDRPVLDLSISADTLAPANTTLPTGGILKKYQLLTPGLITSLLVTFFILIPVVLMGMNALASIQTPIRSDMGKTFNAQERKNQ
ncbi:hypothetical protein GALMADRAFT_250537 [Galerina marginata CBS 339.88]|uniref:Protein BIG1 n=1 Tax=Galerina marginata (strain CBS 339.88) TaxID=685588 RepID=A0A067SUI5_GALM3|nr:hypothetical protein GALMADRAFT_250537 [Galerina marginata CBS 339.88]